MNFPYRYIGSLALLSGLCVTLLIIRMATTSSLRYGFMFWNLFLALVPLLLAWWLVVRVRRYGWRKWQQVVLTAAWVTFLPNSFYLVTDLIHLRPNYEADLLFDITMLMSFISAGFAFGFASLYLIHCEILKRTSELRAFGFVGLILLASSFAICLGRYTRWNTWDILLQPVGLLFDVSDRLINPAAHLQTYQTTVILFLLLFVCYLVIWEAVRWLRRS